MTTVSTTVPPGCVLDLIDSNEDREIKLGQGGRGRKGALRGCNMNNSPIVYVVQ